MNIERDKWYVMRNGEKVRVVCVDAPGEYPVIGIDKDGALTFTATGHFEKEGVNHRFDLISEYREPARVWVNFYPDDAHMAFDSAAAAHENHGAHATRIAVEFVEVVK